MHALRVFLAVVTVGALAACQSDVTEPSGPVPDVVSVFVVSVGSPTDYTRVLVTDGGLPVSPGAIRRYSLVVSPSTTILLRQPSGSLVPGRVRDITPGDSLRAWRTGVELRSLTPQYPTTRIEVIPGIVP